MRQYLRMTVLLPALLVFLFAQSTTAMDFDIADHQLHGTGEIKRGDTERFKQFIVDRKIAPDIAADPYVLHLSSQGGDPTEGIALGRAIRESDIETEVDKADSCSSACALAFLGGLRLYVTGSGVGRTLEFGAHLGFQGFEAAKDVRSALAYAKDMGGVDIGWLAKALTAPPTEPTLVSRPRDIAALSIDVANLPTKIPDGWYTNVCRNVMSGLIPELDSGERVIDTSAANLGSIKALREALITARFEDTPMARLSQSLNDSDAIDMALGEPFYLSMVKPILEARNVELERGAGFYFDNCLAILSKDSLAIILIDGVGHRIVVRDFTREEGMLKMFAPDSRLW